MTTDNTLRFIEENKVIVIVRGVAKDDLIPLTEAMYLGGIRMVECTYDANGLVPDEEIAERIGDLVKHFNDRMLIGAGTVMTVRQVELTQTVGGSFIISPDTNEEVIALTKKLGLVSIPGAITPTEVAIAHRAGADFVKLFPIDLYGAKYIKMLRAPLSNVKLIAVNGITPENMTEYLNAGAIGVGVGSGIVNKTYIKSGEFDRITSLAKEYTDKLNL